MPDCDISSCKHNTYIQLGKKPQNILKGKSHLKTFTHFSHLSGGEMSQFYRDSMCSE